MLPWLALTFLLGGPVPVAAVSNVAGTVHNLTPEGPGTVKETVATGVCVFCHTPHTASPQRALWNRNNAPVTYQLYTSSTTRANVNQPTGSSRLCLSCHDGTVALGNLRRPPNKQQLKLGPMTGTKVHGHDLRYDHPISFVYDSTLAAMHPGLLDPAGLPKEVALDSAKQLQCTSCHDAHEATNRHFLRSDNTGGALCLACHQPAGWRQSAHATSTATWTGIGRNPWPSGSPQSVAGNACNNCHRSHTAGRGSRLMAQAVEAENCTICHDGSVARKNVAAALAGGSRHPIGDGEWTHDPLENPVNMSRHVTCADCHNAHAATGQSGAALPGSLQGVSGATVGGASIAVAARESEICNKCHAVREPTTAGILRVDSTRNVGERIASGRSSHLSATANLAAARNGLSTRALSTRALSGSAMTCTDCHNNSDWIAGGNAARGPHGSRYAPILARNYATNDRTGESSASYDLCYGCHDRSALMTDGPGRFPHRAHVVDQNAPCAACHDSHGSRQNAHLIDFMMRDLAGRTVVTVNGKGRLAYASTGVGQGKCDLRCHGSDHDARAYGVTLALKPPTTPTPPTVSPVPALPSSMLPTIPSAVGPMRATPSLRSPQTK